MAVNEVEPLEELLSRVDNTERRDSIYICVFVDEQNYADISKLAGKYGVLGHSFDRQHVYVRAKSRRKARGLLKKVLSEKKPVEGVKGAYVNTVEPLAPGLDLEHEVKLRYEFRSALDINKDWPVLIGLYQAVKDAGRVEEMIEKLKEFGEIKQPYDWDPVHLKMKPHSKEYFERFKQYRIEVESGIEWADWSAGKFYPCGER